MPSRKVKIATSSWRKMKIIISIFLNFFFFFSLKMKLTWNDPIHQHWTADCAATGCCDCWAIRSRKQIRTPIRNPEPNRKRKRKRNDWCWCSTNSSNGPTSTLWCPWRPSGSLWCRPPRRRCCRWCRSFQRRRRGCCCRETLGRRSRPLNRRLDLNKASDDVINSNWGRFLSLGQVFVNISGFSGQNWSKIGTFGQSFSV